MAEVLLQRTRASAVTPVYTELIERFPDPASLAAAGEEELASLFRPLGLAWRIPLLRQLASCLAERGGRVPLSFDELRTLPLVGDYVAAAYLSLHAGHRAVLIDANVVRWLCRLTGRPYGGETRRKLWLRELAESVTPRQQVREFNYALLDFTMDVCAVRPACNRCPLRRICEYGAG
ncbi:MAG: A/G-specific adenine glycosylase [Armatimonadota bacterium]